MTKSKSIVTPTIRASRKQKGSIMPYLILSIVACLYAAVFVAGAAA